MAQFLLLKGFKTNEKGEKVGYCTMIYSESEVSLHQPAEHHLHILLKAPSSDVGHSQVERIAKVGFETAQKRRKKLCSVDKSNVLEVSQLWREVVTRMAPNYPDVELTHM